MNKFHTILIKNSQELSMFYSFKVNKSVYLRKYHSSKVMAYIRF